MGLWERGFSRTRRTQFLEGHVLTLVCLPLYRPTVVECYTAGAQSGARKMRGVYGEHGSEDIQCVYDSASYYTDASDTCLSLAPPIDVLNVP